MKTKAKLPAVTVSRLAYLYARFSSVAQEEGDSLRRQTTMAERWCQTNGYTMPEHTIYTDKGVSSFRGKHRAVGALSQFLAAVHQGDIPASSVLLIENIDRLSREAPWDFIGLLHDLVKSGIRIVQLDTGEVIDQNTDMFGFMRLLLSQSRGHEESKKKSDRVGENWQNWRQTGMSRQKAMRPGPCPFWIKRTAHGYELNDRAEVLKQIFQWAADGWGIQKIHAQLRREKRKIIVKKNSDGYITNPYLQAVLHNPVAYGRCEELDRDDYFPAAISRELFFKAQGAMNERLKNRTKTRMRDRVHLLSGILENYDTGCSYVVRRWPNTDRYNLYPYDVRSTQETDTESFPVEELETGVLDCLAELDAAKLFGQTVDKLTPLKAEAESLKARIGAIETEMESGDDVKGAMRVLGRLEARLNQLNTEIAEERARLANPVVESLTTVQTTLKLDLKDEAVRLKLRAGLQQVIKRIRIQFRVQGVWRMAFAIIELKQSDQFREMVCLYHRPLAGVVPSYFYSEGAQKFNKTVTPATPEMGFNYLLDIVQREDEKRAKEKHNKRKEYWKTYSKKKVAEKNKKTG